MIGELTDGMITSLGLKRGARTAAREIDKGVDRQKSNDKSESVEWKYTPPGEQWKQ
jgi:hypothetical protein